jgi:hypothetical protein
MYLGRADMLCPPTVSRFVPKAAVSNRSKADNLFDHLVGAGEERRRDFETERLRCFEIDQIPFREVPGATPPLGCAIRRAIGC